MMSYKKIMFLKSSRFWVILGVLVFSISLCLADAFYFHRVFKDSSLHHSMEVKVLPLDSSTSIAATQKNFHVVAPGIWRSAQPSAESFQRMKAYGLKTIVNLRSSSREESWENKFAGQLGVQYYHFPIAAAHVVPAETVDAVLSILSDPKCQPVLIHCRAGKDRTGMMIAAYKMANMGWSFRDVYQEMKLYGFDDIFVPMLTTLRLWNVAHGRADMAQEIALVEKELEA